jgi:Chromo (CHRromatin Organisation MOdifier) domain
MSTAYHPQSDGQTERFNRILEEALRSYVSPTQDDWDEHLDMIEFTLNNSVSSVTGQTPFALNGLSMPRTFIDLAIPLAAPKAQRTVEALRERIKRAKECMRVAQERSKAYADRSRRELTFQVGDYVLLSTVNLRRGMEGCDKLLPRYEGPFRVEALVGTVAYKLELPADYKVHPVFHVSLLKSWKGKVDEAEEAAPAPAYFNRGEPFYTLERIVDHRDRPIPAAAPGKRSKAGKTPRPVREYLVKWLGYGHESNSWEPASIARKPEIREEVNKYFAELQQRAAKEDA